MNKFLYLLIIVFSFFSCTGTDEFDGFIIEGNISGYKSDSLKVLLKSESSLIPVRFEGEINDGKFVIRGKLNTPDMFTLTLPGVKDSLRIFIDNTFITITGVAEDLSGALITGAITNEIAVEHEEELENLSINSKIDELLSIYNSPEISEGQRLLIENEIIKFNTKSRQIDSLFLEKHPKSSYSLYLIAKRSNGFSINYREQKVALFRSIPEFSSNQYLREVEESVATAREIRKGGNAPDFKIRDGETNDILFSDIYKKNRVTLLYFWAGWCNACIKYNNYLKTIYSSFNWRGLEIVGISLDNNNNAFESAIESQNIIWKQYSDFRGWKSPIVGKFLINEIPSAYLIDSTGKIIAFKPSQKNLKQIIRENLLSSEELYHYYKTYSDSLNKERVQ